MYLMTKPWTDMARLPSSFNLSEVLQLSMIKVSYLQGTEVVSAKLFISYMGTNTAKDFKVREKR